MKITIRKRRIIAYFLFITAIPLLWLSFTLFQCYHHGFFGGLHITALTWSLYILCIPAAHGRMLIEVPLHFFTGIMCYPEPFMWTCATALNIITLFFNPALYTQSFGCNILHLILTEPKYWIILFVAMCGSWYRIICGFRRYNTTDRKHLIFRHLIFLIGLSLFIYLTSYDIIVLLNAIANG